MNILKKFFNLNGCKGDEDVVDCPDNCECPPGKSGENGTVFLVVTDEDGNKFEYNIGDKLDGEQDIRYDDTFEIKESDTHHLPKSLPRLIMATGTWAKVDQKDGDGICHPAYCRRGYLGDKCMANSPRVEWGKPYVFEGFSGSTLTLSLKYIANP